MIGTLLSMAAEGVAEAKPDTAGYLLHHVQDGSEWELPGGAGLVHEANIHDWLGHWIVNVGGTPVDITPTRFTLVMWLGTVILLSTLLLSMRNRTAAPKGRLQTTVEMFFVFIRDEIAEPNIGHHAYQYVPYLCSVFFFIMTMNLIGLVPFLATPTGNLGMTVVLALCTFFITQLAGMREQGVVGYWTHLVPSGVPAVLYPLFIPIELVGLFTKPFALMMRLFANMVAGHIVIYFLLGLIFFFGTLAVAPVAVPFAFAIYLLELFVALLQAYVFTMLSAVFIGLASHSH
jgi:F-type H+-transporting ATPase subunit a